MYQNHSDVIVVEQGLVTQRATEGDIHLEDGVVNKLCGQHAARGKGEKQNFLKFNGVLRNTKCNQTSEKEGKNDARNQNNYSVDEVSNNCHLL